MSFNKISSEVIELVLDNYISSTVKAGSSVSDLGYRVYADAAGVTPVDGTGGTPGVTLSVNTSSPLSGSGDLRLVKDAVNRQGNGFSTDFTVANRHLAKVLQVTFDTELVSGTYSAGDLRVYLVQDPNGTPVVLEPVNTGVQLGIANQRLRHIASFQTHVSVTSYRLCVHVSTTSASAYTVDFANFKVWEPTQSIGSVITDWKSYGNSALAIPGWANCDTRELYYCRVGGYVKISGRIQNGTSVSATLVDFPLPSGLVTASNVNGRYNNGYLIRDVTQNNVNKFPIIIQPGKNYFNIGLEYSTASNALSPIFGNNFGTSEWLSIETEIPIQGWGSSVAMSSDTGDSRVVAARYINGSANTVSTTVPFHFNTLSYDTHGGITKGTAGSSGAFFYTAPVSGYYRVSCCVGMNSTNGVSAFVNDVDTILLGQGTNGILTNYSGQVFLNAGQKVDIRPNSGSFTSVSNANNFFAIERISAGSQVVATQETVAAGYYMNANQTIAGTASQLNFNTRFYDTHGAVTTGTSWKFTAPMTGKYRISGHLGADVASQRVTLYKNNSLFNYQIGRFPAGGNYWNYVFDIDLLSGDYFDLRNTYGSTINYVGGTITSNECCAIYISRIM